MEQIEAKDFLFYYNPNLEELIVSSGLKFMKETMMNLKLT